MGFVRARACASERDTAASGLREEYGDAYIDLQVEGTNCFLIRPAEEASGARQPWIWYAPTFLGKDGYPNHIHDWIFSRVRSQGYWIAGCDIGESFGNLAGRAAYTKFYDYVVARYHLSAKPCLFAQSRGGLMLFNWAADHPQNVGCIVGVYPVCNILSWPSRLEKVVKAYNMSEGELRKQLDRYNPVDRLWPLAQRNVPIFLIHGDSDKVVPLESNSRELADRYRKLSGSVQLVVVKGIGHAERPEFFESKDVVDFLLDHRSGGKP